MHTLPSHCAEPEWVPGKRCRLEENLREINTVLDTIERDEALAQAAGFGGRVQAIDWLRDDVIEPVVGVLAAGGHDEELMALKQRAEAVSARLEAANETLLGKLRASISAGKLSGEALRQELVAAAGPSADEASENIAGYDDLDSLVSRLLIPQAPPQEIKALEPEMVFYQPTPARVILDLVERAGFQPDDIFYDLGSGLGQVVMLVSLLGNVGARGIEAEPAFSEYARQCARELHLSAVNFIAADVREADISDGTLFFMYTPFEGEMLEQVLARLRVEAESRTIRVYSYGPSNLVLSKQAWLEALDSNSDQTYRLAGFKSAEST